jgi:glycine cleavage system aminomethyltransferase T
MTGTPQQRTLQFLLEDPQPLMHGNEIIHLVGQSVGYIQVGAYGHALGGAVGIGFAEIDKPLSAERIASGKWSVLIAERSVEAKASLKPMFDPKMECVRA